MKWVGMTCVLAELLLVAGCGTNTPVETKDDEATRTPSAPGSAASFVLPSPWTDPQDVALANADMLAGTVLVGEGTVELRVRFAALPFPNTATHYIDWCIDLDQNPNTGNLCGNSELLGTDAVVDLRSDPERPFQLHVLRTGRLAVQLDPAHHLFVDASTNTLRVCFPDSLLLGDTQFNYLVGSIFGGSGGSNDFAPNTPSFGQPSGAFVNETGSPTPCCPSSTTVCGEVAARADADCPCAGPWQNHTAYVNCVTRTALRELAPWGGCFTPAELKELTRCVVDPRAASQCGRGRFGSSGDGSPPGQTLEPVH